MPRASFDIRVSYMEIIVVLLTIISGALAIILGFTAKKSAENRDRAVVLQQDLDNAAREIQQRRSTDERAQKQLLEHNSSLDGLRLSYQQLEIEAKSKARLLQEKQEEIDLLENQLEERPHYKRHVFRIVTIGKKGTGKTALTKKWARPTFDLGEVQGTEYQAYTKTVSRVHGNKTITDIDIEIHDWGGEHIVQAHEQLSHHEIHGLLFVVDLARDGGEVDAERVQEQLTEFTPQVLQYYLSGSRITQHCQTVVLFINKSDVISTSPLEAEEKAREVYKTLIDDINTFANKVSVKVIVGSGLYGHGTHILFGHFIRSFLPDDAYSKDMLPK